MAALKIMRLFVTLVSSGSFDFANAPLGMTGWGYHVSTMSF